MVRRVYVEKKKAFAVQARELRHEIRHDLQLPQVEDVRVFIRYDVENLSEETYRKALKTVFAEPPVDDVYEETLPEAERSHIFSVAYLPGQFDQRADSAEQCLRFLNETEDSRVQSAVTYMLIGDLSEEELKRVIRQIVNPVDSAVCGEEKPETLLQSYREAEDVEILHGFSTMRNGPLMDFYKRLNLAMTFADFKYIQSYFLDEEHRDPTMTEIRVLDTYWSDHCRHTTFSTQIKHVCFGDGDYRQAIEGTFLRYLEDRKEYYGEDTERDICLMDLATLAAKKLKKEGKLPDLEESEEINACSIVAPVDVNGTEEEWLINFKNETHNHPTEIEPFGGAATCLGGAIRDPLSGRTYVYQAMRVTGAADPTRPRSETLPGKLPQKKLVRLAAKGYSSYGNQIGLATGCVKEIYHSNYAAKRMEIGAVIAAAPRRAVRRESPVPGDVILLLGGRTGRDGIGGATGSSRKHTVASTEQCGAEVQKGNAPTERKLQRLFRREEVSKLIKKCNDFGAGGVAVAIGELADGLIVNLDQVPKKYAGLDGTELAISESQERMAVLLDPKDVDEFLRYAALENLEASLVAEVTETPRLVLKWRGREIVNLSRAFLNTNGAHQETRAFVEMPKRGISELNQHPWSWYERGDDDIRGRWTHLLSDLNVCSQKGLVEMFDSSIGAGSVLMPYGGKYQMTETQVMVAKVPVPAGETNTVTFMSYGFDPNLSSWSPYHGAAWAVAVSIAKIAAAGGDVSGVRFSFQEYFRRMNREPGRWSQPVAALLGAYDAQMGFGLPAIGGKDSMSGSFEELDVPPTLVSFAVSVGKLQDVISPEFKQPGSKIIWIRAPRDDNQLPAYQDFLRTCGKLREDIQAGRVISAYVVGRFGIAEAVSKMAFGNHLGLKIEHDLSPIDFFSPCYGDFICEVREGGVGALASTYRVIGEVTDTGAFCYGNVHIPLEEALASWTGRLESVFPTKSYEENEACQAPFFDPKRIAVCGHKLAMPRVFIPVFPGTNCEYDSARAFEEAGALVNCRVFRNLTELDIRESVEEFAKMIGEAQIIFFPGGFSAGDEPDGSAKFFATAFQNARIREGVEKLLKERDGLALGICNGFQALIKLGLVPGGSITGQMEGSPTLTYNTIGRHVSRMVCTKVVSRKSPWLQNAVLGGVYVTPASHGEGRFVANAEWLRKLADNGQIATQYCDTEGRVTMDEEWNVNGSFMAIEGITSPDGRVFGKMAHVERRGRGVAVNIPGEQDLGIFRAGVGYFRS